MPYSIEFISFRSGTFEFVSEAIFGPSWVISFYRGQTVDANQSPQPPQPQFDLIGLDLNRQKLIAQRLSRDDQWALQSRIYPPPCPLENEGVTGAGHP
jgi:hypothetical protein